MRSYEVDRMSAHTVLNDPHAGLHRELAPAVLEKCRELVSEYAALAQADAAAFPFTAQSLLDWYFDMKRRLEFENLAVARRPVRIRRRKAAA